MRPDIYTRLLTHSILKQVIFSDKSFDAVFTAVITPVQISVSDKAFVRLLSINCLRYYGQIQQILNHLIAKPLPKKLTDVYVALVIGVCSYCFLKTPAHAAVNTTVDLVRQLKKMGLTRFVNGVLRRLTDTETHWSDWTDFHMVVPHWLQHSLDAAYGAGKTMRILSACLSEPALDITPRDNPADWAIRLNGTLLPTGSVRLKHTGPLSDLDGFSDGAWWVQNAAAALPVQLLSVHAGMRVADLCAAPGGKTAQLATQGASVTACDISSKRLERLLENMTRLKLDASVRIVEADIRTLDESTSFDAVLLDAPCSATGTLQRHPDLIFHRQESDIQRLSELQKELLQKAVRLTKAGGDIIYVTCSLLPAEGEEVVDAVLKDNTNLTICPAFGQHFAPFLTSQGYLRTFPDDGFDGFFIAHLKKEA